MSAIPTTAARTAALAATGRRIGVVLDIIPKRCSRTYGVAPCTAAAGVGNECYNTYATCQDKPNYGATTQTLHFVSRGVMAPPGETLRPYVLSSLSAPSSVDLDNGLASRNVVTVTLADEPCLDDQDPYRATRATPAQGTFWTRFLARNKNYSGCTALLRHGFVADPWDWNLFLDEKYIIDKVSLEGNGQVKLTLKDPLKLTDRATIPAPTDGKLSVDLKAAEYTGAVISATNSTIVLTQDASPTDSAYNGMEVWVYSGTGSGQRRVVSSYDGASRTATLTANWSVLPDSASWAEVAALSINVGTGKGAQYADPATSGKPEYIRIGSELIRYTAKSTDTLSWSSNIYRATWGSAREDHSSGDSVQLCRAFEDVSVSSCITSLLTESGVDASLISADVATQGAIWYAAPYNVYAIISAPEQVSKLLQEILTEIGAIMWWSPQVQKVEFKAVMPELATPTAFTDEANIIAGSMTVRVLDELRLTRFAVNYALRDASASKSEPRNFGIADIVVNANAESTNEYGDVRSKVVYSRWFDSRARVGMVATATRNINRRYDAPRSFAFRLDHKDYTVPVGALITIKSHKHTDETGAPKVETAIITKLDDRSTHIEIEARSTNFGNGRYAFIAPDGTADYPTDQVYAHISDAAGLMSDGSAGYLIV